MPEVILFDSIFDPQLVNKIAGKLKESYLLYMDVKRKENIMPDNRPSSTWAVTLSTEPSHLNGKLQGSWHLSKIDVFNDRFVYEVNGDSDENRYAINATHYAYAVGSVLTAAGFDIMMNLNDDDSEQIGYLEFNDFSKLLAGLKDLGHWPDMTEAESIIRG